MANEDYDLLVIGAGAAGSSAVTIAAKKGRRFASHETTIQIQPCAIYQ